MTTNKHQLESHWSHLSLTKPGIRESMVDCLRDQLIPPASLLKASPGNQETSRWDPAGHADNRPWIPFLTRELFLFEIDLFHTINNICFQMLCYSRCVRHVCFGINGPITAQLSNGPWQLSGIAWSHLLLSFTFPYINWPITEGEKTRRQAGGITQTINHGLPFSPDN